MKSTNVIIRKKSLWKSIVEQWRLYVLLLPALICLIVFHFLPMYGVNIAFKDLHIGQSMFEGQWVGFRQFIRLFSSDLFPVILKNTLVITLTQTLLLWPIWLHAIHRIKR